MFDLSIDNLSQQLTQLRKQVIDLILPNRAQAAVIIPIFKHNQSVLLTKRTSNVAYHKGQISFPGGKQEPHDNNLLATALREMQEEVGITAKQVNVIGQMPAYPTLSSTFQVTPFLSLVEKTSLQLDHNEVETTLSLPLNYLIDYFAQHPIDWHNLADKRNLRIPYQGQIIWGLTAIILSDLVMLVRDC